MKDIFFCQGYSCIQAFNKYMALRKNQLMVTTSSNAGTGIIFDEQELIHEVLKYTLVISVFSFHIGPRSISEYKLVFPTILINPSVKNILLQGSFLAVRFIDKPAVFFSRNGNAMSVNGFFVGDVAEDVFAYFEFIASVVFDDQIVKDINLIGGFVVGFPSVLTN